jgi:tetratricopeptide (TPR) repeat protein
LSDSEDASTRALVEAGNLTFLANAYRDLGKYDKTISLSEQALSAGASLNDKRLESSALGYLGIAHYYRSNYEEATTHVQKALEASQQAEQVDKDIRAELLRYLGHAYRGMGNYDEAIRAYEQSLKTAQEFGDLSAENNALGALGRIYCDSGKHELARTEYLDKALQIAVEIGDRNAESYALAHLGLAHRDLGLYTEAIEFYDKALQVAAEISHQQVQTYGNGGIGKTYLALRDFPNAIKHTQEAVRLAGEIGMKRAQQFWETTLAETYLHMGELDRALTEVEKAFVYKSPWVKYRSHALKGLMLARRGQPDLASESFKQAAADAEKILSTTPSYFDAQYYLGFALNGMALTNPNDRASLVSQSSAAFENAYAICKSSGVINEALRLIDELLIVDDDGELKRPRDLLQQLAKS